MTTHSISSSSTLIYELVNLQKPFQSVPAEAVIWRVGRGECQSLTLVPKGRLRTLISRCWAEQPSSRPSFKELLTTLEQNVSIEEPVSLWLSEVIAQLCLVCSMESEELILKQFHNYYGTLCTRICISNSISSCMACNINSFPLNDTVWCHHGHGLSISVWEFIWGV